MHRLNDLTRHAMTGTLFGIALGVSTLVYPLMALDVGFAAAAVGGFTAISAASQFGVRLALPAVLSRVSDRRVMMVASGALAASFAILYLSSAVVAFLAAQVLQGAARALFWTANQTYSVRGRDETTRNIARAQAFGTSGGLVGPILGGALAAVSVSLAVVSGATLALVTMAAAATLRHHDPYQREPGRRPVWRLEGIGLSAWAGMTGGVWRGVVDSFLPVVASSAGIGAQGIGLLVALSDGAGFAATLATARWRIDRAMLAVVVGAAFAVAGATVALAVSGHFAVLTAVALVGGTGGGLGLVLAPAAAAKVAVGGDQGAGIALAGTYRAAARFVAPGTISAVAALVSLSVGLGAVGVLVAAPVAIIRRWR